MNLRGLLAVSICALTLFVVRSAYSEQPRSYAKMQIEIKGLKGGWTSLYYSVRWNQSTKRCEGRQSNSVSDSGWSPLLFQDCLVFKKELEQKFEKIKSSAIGKDARFPMVYGIGTGELNFDDIRVPVELATSERCDASFTQCEQPKLDAASEFALLIRNSITKTLGRLPVRSDFPRN